jgi:acetyltransferase
VEKKPSVTTASLNPINRLYPSQYVLPWTLKGGIEVTIRPIRADDEPLMVKFHETLSDRTQMSRCFIMLGT